MENVNERCPVCGQNAEVSGMQDGRFGIMVNCERCGLYKLSSEVIRELSKPQGLTLRASMAFLLLSERKKDDIPFHFVDDGYQNRAIRSYEDQCKIVTLSEVLQYAPSMHKEKIDRIILNLASLSDDVGDVITIPYADTIALRNIFFIEETNESKLEIKANYLLNYLAGQKLVKPLADMLSGLSFTLDIEGWLRAEKLQKKRDTIPVVVVIEPPKKKYRRAVKDSVLALRMKTLVLVRESEQDRIPTEWLHEIRHAKAVVIDYSADKDILHYLMGFSDGIDAKLIVTVKRGKEKGIMNVYPSCFEPIRYQDQEDLAERLIARIHTITED